MTWVVLLRGVNVAGITVKSVDLRRVLADYGFTGVVTVLASGNVVLEADSTAAVVKFDVEEALRKGFGYDAWVVVLTPQRLAEIAARYPFPRQDEEFHPYCVFASDPERIAELAQRAQAGDADLLQLDGDVLYWRVARGSSTDTPFAKLAAAKRWKPFLTTRNLRTVDKIVAAAAR